MVIGTQIMMSPGNIKLALLGAACNIMQVKKNKSAQSAPSCSVSGIAKFSLNDEILPKQINTLSSEIAKS